MQESQYLDTRRAMNVVAAIIRQARADITKDKPKRGNISNDGYVCFALIHTHPAHECATTFLEKMDSFIHDTNTDDATEIALEIMSWLR